MRVPRILALEFTRETALYTALGFSAVVLLLISQNLVARLDDLTMIGLTAGDFAAVLGSLIPVLASYATPIALVFGLLLALQRMSGDGEILAMQSCGIGLGPLLAPALALGAGAALLCAWLIISVEHRARSEMVAIFEKTATKGGVLEPGRFRVIGDRLVFIDGRDRQGGLEGVMIADYSNPSRLLRIFAERGRLVFDDDDDRLRFELSDGDVQIATHGDDPLDEQRMAFAELSYAFDIGGLLGRAYSPVRPRQMSLDELRAVLARAETGDALFGLDERDPIEYAIEIQRRFALPLAPLLFSIAAVPLGVRVRRGGRSTGIVLCAALVGGYYALLAGGQVLARSALVGPVVGLWGPTLLFGVIALFLLARAGRGIGA
jgi:LPS export ABC transporter permease LptF